LLAGIDAGLAVRATDRPQSIAGWRQILSLTAAPDDALTVAARSRPDPAATIVANVPRPAAPPPPAPGGVEPVVSGPALPAGNPKSRRALYAGTAVAALILAGGSYFMLAPKPPAQGAPTPQAVAVQDMKIEDLERALTERRAADAAAAEKKRLEEAAQKKATDEGAAKQMADAELERAQQLRQKAEEDLAKLRAEIVARRQEEQTLAMRAEAEAAQRKAEAEMAALRQAETDAQKKAAADADAKRLADEALAKAQAERQKAEADARQKADAEVAAASDKKTAEAGEVALRHTPSDRQRIQVALTSLGFDTRGNDGALGPRSREMIANWQKAHAQPATGFLTGSQHQALLREAAPAIARYNDDQKKIEDEKKKADEDARAKAAAVAAAPAAPLPPAAASAPVAAIAPAAAPAGTAQWAGKAMCDFWPGPIPVSVTVTDGKGSGTGTGRSTGTTVTVNISGNSYSGSINARLRNGNPKTLVGSFSGALSGSQIRSQTIVRADMANPMGPNVSSCTIELDRAG
jgi:hypothetical protein